MLIINTKIKIILFCFLGLTVLVSIAFFAWYYLRSKKTQNNRAAEKIDYVIPGIPYIGIYNHRDSLSFLSSDKPAAIASVLEYWNPGKNNFRSIDQFFPDFVEKKTPASNRSREEIEKFIVSQDSYTAKTEQLKIDELKKYINPQTKTPLILPLALDENQPIIIPYYPMKVLIGIKESEQKVVFHDFWLGNNYELTYQEFNQLLEKTNPRLSKKYLVIQPNDLEKKLKEINARNIAPYPSRTQIMEKNPSILKDFIYGSAVLKYDLPANMAIDYLLKAKNNPDFENSLPPVFKTLLFFRLANAYLTLGNIDDAFAAAQQSVELNHNLDQPFGDWPGYEIPYNTPSYIGQISGPFRILGDIYKKREELEKAEENYQKALEVYPDNQLAQDGLESLTVK